MVCSMCRARSSVAAISRRLVAANSASRCRRAPASREARNQTVTEIKATEPMWAANTPRKIVQHCGREGGPHRLRRNHPGTFQHDTQHVHRQGNPRHGQALRRRKEDADQDDVEKIHQGCDGITLPRKWTTAVSTARSTRICSHKPRWAATARFGLFLTARSIAR